MPSKAPINPKPWPKGVSGNPGGRPKGDKELREACRQNAGKAIQALLAALQSPRERVTAAAILLAYGYGRPVQTQNVRVIHSIEDLSEEELMQLAGMDGQRQIEGTAV